jgi:hypothetical protein
LKRPGTVDREDGRLLGEAADAQGIEHVGDEARREESAV